MTSESPLLTIEQKKRLITRGEKKESKLDAYKKRHNDQVVLKKFGDYLESIPDMLLILEHMPSEKISKKLKQEHISLMLDLLDRLIERLDPWPIGEHENGEQWAFKTYGCSFPTCELGKCVIETASRTALEEDINLHRQLKNHLNKLWPYVDPCIPDPVCHDPQYNKDLHEKMLQFTRTFQFSSSVNCYSDEYITDGSSWVQRKPSTVDIDQLGEIRWKPRGLKECLESPLRPFLEEKKIPRGPEVMHAHVENTAEGTRYLISESGGEERSVTREKYLEIVKKYGMVKKAAEETK